MIKIGPTCGKFSECSKQIDSWLEVGFRFAREEMLAFYSGADIGAPVPLRVSYQRGRS